MYKLSLQCEGLLYEEGHSTKHLSFLFSLPGGMSSGGIIGLVIGSLLLLLAGALIIFFVVTHRSSKKASLNIASGGGTETGFDNALYRANRDSVHVTDDNKNNEDEQKANDIAVISDAKLEA